MRKFGKHLQALGVCSALALGCSGDAEQPNDLGVEQPTDGAQQLHVSQADVTQLPEGTPGEAAAERVDKARDCVYIEWCNEPGPRGTICRVRPECGCSGVIECNEDARAVCGGFVDPAYFLCNR